MAEDEDFAALFEQSMSATKGATYRRLKTGDVVEATVVHLAAQSMLVFVV